MDILIILWNAKTPIKAYEVLEQLRTKRKNAESHPFPYIPLYSLRGLSKTNMMSLGVFVFLLKNNSYLIV